MVRIAARHEGRFGGDRYPWSLEISGAGRALLSIDEHPPKQREFTLSPAQWSQLTDVLERIDMRSLPAELGKAVPDGNVKSLEIEYGDGTRIRTTLLSIGHLKESEQKAARRFIDAWLAIRGLFDDPAAVDLREYIENWKP